MAFDYCITGSRFAIVLYCQDGTASIICYTGTESEALRAVTFLEDGRR